MFPSNGSARRLPHSLPGDRPATPPRSPRSLGGQRAQPDPGAEQTGPGPEVETSREEYGSEEQGQKEKALLGTGRGAVTVPTLSECCRRNNLDPKASEIKELAVLSCRQIQQ
ncbi:unnamed protein product [Gadus morhua 'NCC']